MDKAPTMVSNPTCREVLIGAAAVAASAALPFPAPLAAISAPVEGGP
jgi:hypothetical protein